MHKNILLFFTFPEMFTYKKNRCLEDCLLNNQECNSQFWSKFTAANKTMTNLCKVFYASIIHVFNLFCEKCCIILFTERFSQNWAFAKLKLVEQIE